MMKELEYPFDSEYIVRKAKSIKRRLTENVEGMPVKRIAILGGSTTSAFKDYLELFLLDAGIRPEFYESEYNKYYEDSVFSNPALDEFKPELAVIYTSSVNISEYPAATMTGEDVDELFKRQCEHLEQVWKNLHDRFGCTIVQNNFDYSGMRLLGNADASEPVGYTNYINRVNAYIAEYAAASNYLYVNDICYLAYEIGRREWFNPTLYFSYKLAITTAATVRVAYSASAVIKAILGRVKKCIVLDLDNTLWGGVISEDGLEGIKLGNETPLGEAYQTFHKYLLALKSRGVLLSVCSKNDEDIAKLGFTHPDSLIKVTDFVAFKANWQNKDANIVEISKELNLGLDSFVFIDDNPAERELVRETLPMVAVPEIDPNDVMGYISIIDGAGYFESLAISEDDKRRSESYAARKAAIELGNSFADYGEFLKSLDMHAKIAPFEQIYYERIAQLTNKSNQYNLTTKRCTVSDIEGYATDSDKISLYARLTDKFGDNGLVSVVAGTIVDDCLEVELWLMSCRVLKRDLEKAVMDVLYNVCRDRGIKTIRGYYYPTAKNAMVLDHYELLGFSLVSKDESKTVFELDLDEEYINKNIAISVDFEGI